MLRFGSSGDGVATLQTFLRALGFDPGPVDGGFGQRTQAAVRAWQEREGLEADGVFGPASYARAAALGWRPWIPSRHFRRASRGPGSIHLIVVHCTQGPETPRRALATAAWFDDPRSQVSAHYIVDPELTVQCVREADIAWHAGAANERSIGIELCGRADQTAEQWADEPSRRELGRAAGLVADICRRHALPVVQLTDPEQLRRGERGLAGHDLCSRTWGGTHYDPGPAFPWAHFLELVRMAQHEQEAA